MLTNCAPVYVTVYDRYDHFARCIDSLAKNAECGDTEIYISSDGPKSVLSERAVNDVRRLIGKIDCFKKVHAFCPPENTNGRIRSDVRKILQNQADRYIITEDDNIFSRHALNYFNWALSKYEKDDGIEAITGYMFPGVESSKPSSNSCIRLPLLAGWGFATWKSKDPILSFDAKKYSRAILSDYEKYEKINNVAPSLIPLIEKMANDDWFAGDILWSCKMILEEKYCIFPEQTLVKNTGNDGSGINCGNIVKFQRQIVTDEPIRHFVHVSVSLEKKYRTRVFRFYGGYPHYLLNFLKFIKQKRLTRSICLNISINLIRLYIKCCRKSANIVLMIFEKFRLNFNGVKNYRLR